MLTKPIETNDADVDKLWYNFDEYTIDRWVRLMNKGGFSWSRLLGISAAKSKISRSIGVPLTKSGRERKLGAVILKLFTKK